MLFGYQKVDISIDIVEREKHNQYSLIHYQVSLHPLSLLVITFYQAHL